MLYNSAQKRISKDLNRDFILFVGKLLKYFDLFTCITFKDLKLKLPLEANLLLIPCIMCVQYCGGVQYRGGFMSTVGGISSFVI